MLMPETPPHLDSYLLLWENHVWLSGEVLAADAESQPHPVQRRSQLEFRLCVPPFDLGHIARTAFGIDCVDHGSGSLGRN